MSRPGPSSQGEGLLAGLSPALRQRLAKLDIRTSDDLILHLPLRYEDETRLQNLADATAGDTIQIEAEVIATDVQSRPRRQLLCRVRCDGAELTLRFLHFHAGQAKQMAPGVRLRLRGELRRSLLGTDMVHPRYRVVAAGTPLPESLTPVYPTTAGLAQSALRGLVRRALAEFAAAEPFSSAMLSALHLPGLRESLHHLHHPAPDASLEALSERTHPAWRRIKFEELLAQQLSLRQHLRRRRSIEAPALAQWDPLAAGLLERLPFRLTQAQHRVLEEIRADLARAYPMRRLLQGDVGSGKTVVAALAALQAVQSGYQVAVMAPTEILAEQHFAGFRVWLEPLGVRIAWIAGSLPRREREAMAGRVASGEAQVVVGTHALFQASALFHRLGLVVVDEQHRFGVAQRLALTGKGAQSALGAEPHQLMMSATPIPRTLAMSYYADLEVSVIDELPPGRTPVVTKLVSAHRRDAVLERVRASCAAGHQAYWVCPLIEESETLDLRTAEETYEQLLALLPELEVGLIHGRLLAADKEAIMSRFKAGQIQVLVATTVIEVGVDVPNANLMVIEHSERMGLSQLHQLRGRVGRGAAASACILLYQAPLGEAARERLRVIYESSDGFEIAQADLRIRGPGELLGSRQSGVPALRFADLDLDADLLEAARYWADRLLREDPERAEKHLRRWFAGREEYLRA